jgi:Na+-transporting NADH:ubiquinone oxidoreductase subunit B
MEFFRYFLEKQKKYFIDGGKFEKFYFLFEAMEGFLYTSGATTKTAPHVRDSIDLKRVMVTVVFALIPCVLMALYNTGYQANIELAKHGITSIEGWRGSILAFLHLPLNPKVHVSNLLFGALFFFPVYIITLAVGGLWEVIFASVRKHEINEGFLVTSLLFPLILPPMIPLWQVAVGISFGVVIGKEIFGGTGMNILNPALTGRAFLFFAYPANISGDKVWVAVDGISKATPLAELKDPVLELTVSLKDAFWGFIPGSMGETSVFACLLGAVVLIITGVASWRIMVSGLVGFGGMAYLFNQIGSSTNPMFEVSPLTHLVLGGFAFGLVFMATDPVTGAMTNIGRYVYGLLIGVLVMLIRVVNPAFPEGVMLAILFMNVFAPIIDRVVINMNIKRRRLRNVG